LLTGPIFGIILPICEVFYRHMRSICIHLGYIFSDIFGYGELMRAKVEYYKKSSKKIEKEIEKIEKDLEKNRRAVDSSQ